MPLPAYGKPFVTSLKVAQLGYQKEPKLNLLLSLAQVCPSLFEAASLLQPHISCVIEAI